MAKSRNQRRKSKNSFYKNKKGFTNRGRTYCATNILKRKPPKFSLIVNSGANTSIDYSKVMCFKPEDIQKQYKWSFERGKYHPQTKIILQKCFVDGNMTGEKWELKQVFNSYATIQHKQIIGLLECFLWSMEVMKKNGKFIPLFCQYPEANLHPNQQSVLADVFMCLMEYGEELEEQVKKKLSGQKS